MSDASISSMKISVGVVFAFFEQVPHTGSAHLIALGTGDKNGTPASPAIALAR